MFVFLPLACKHDIIFAAQHVERSRSLAYRARLESACTVRYRGFESHPLRQMPRLGAFFIDSQFIIFSIRTN